VAPPAAGRPFPLVARVRLVSEVVAAYVRARWRIGHGDLPSAVAALRAGGPQPPAAGDDARRAALRLAHATRRTLALIPADSRCLMRSLVVTRLLARRGIASTLVLAARVEGGFEAHAWVEVDGRAVLEPGYPPFQRLVEL
jgi:hypothetical protein